MICDWSSITVISWHQLQKIRIFMSFLVWLRPSGAMKFSCWDASKRCRWFWHLSESWRSRVMSFVRFPRPAFWFVKVGFFFVFVFVFFLNHFKRVILFRIHCWGSGFVSVSLFKQMTEVFVFQSVWPSRIATLFGGKKTTTTKSMKWLIFISHVDRCFSLSQIN